MFSTGNCLRGVAAAVASAIISGAVPVQAGASPAPAAERAAARLGYDTYVVANLIAAPAALERDDAQAFVDATFAEIDARTDASLRARFAAVREMLRPDAARTLDPTEAGASYLAAVAELARTVDAGAFGAYELGSYTATVGFNARVLREDATDASFRKSIATQDALDAAIPALAAARAKLAADGPDAWDTIGTDADAVAALVRGGSAPPPLPAKSVWALLVRGRPVASDGPRAGTLHTSLEIVYGDGSHVTLGAYPGGAYDFSATSATLVCERNREPVTGPSRAFVLVPPKNVTQETLADHFLAACRAFDAHRPRFRYVPADDRHSNDNAFVLDLLRAESLDLPRGL